MAPIVPGPTHQMAPPPLPLNGHHANLPTTHHMPPTPLPLNGHHVILPAPAPLNLATIVTAPCMPEA